MNLNTKQIRKAIAALTAFIKKDRENKIEKKELFDDDEIDIYIQIALKNSPLKRTLRNKPIPILLPHPLYTRFGQEVCLFTKDPQRQYKTMLEENPIPQITKVIGVSKLKDKYPTYEDKRNLLSSYSLFLADARIISKLPALLGTKFFKKKRQPISVNIKNANQMEKTVKKALNSTSFVLSGPCNNVKIGNTGMEIDEIVANISESLQQIIKNIPKGWKNIQSVGVKTANSAYLPFYNCTPDETDEPLPKKRAATEESSIDEVITKKPKNDNNNNDNNNNIDESSDKKKKKKKKKKKNSE